MSIEKEVFPFMAKDEVLYAFNLEGTHVSTVEPLNADTFGT